MLTANQSAAFYSLPGADDSLLHSLLNERRFQFGANNAQLDVIDELNARLVCAALTRRQPVLIVLPDARLHRPALLLVTALLRQWLDMRIAENANGHHDDHDRAVLYAGAHLGIREQLRQTTIEGLGLTLADIFRQRDLGRQGSARTRARSPQATMMIGSSLPRVVTVYAPVDPEAVITNIQPQWMAIDCKDASRLAWLEPLLAAAIERGMPVIAWSENPLSDCVADFMRIGSVLAWPPSPARIRLAHDGIDAMDPDTDDSSGSSIQPLIVAGDGPNTISAALRDASHALASAGRMATSRLLADAVAVHWSFLRAVESLAVPFDFFEEEAPDFWGLRTFAEHRSACERFREVCFSLDAPFAATLDTAGIAIERALGACRQTDPPLWNALCRLIVEELPSDEARLITFTGHSRKQLFLLALLARHNIVEGDLRSLKMWVVTPEELRRLQLARDGLGGDELAAEGPPADFPWHPMLVGLPGPSVTPKLLPVLRQERVDVLIYPHQNAALQRRVGEWNRRLGSSPADVAQALCALGAAPGYVGLGGATEYLRVDEPSGIEAAGAQRRIQLPPQDLWALDDPVAELALLFDGQDGQDGIEEEPTFYEGSITLQNAASRSDMPPAFVDEALEIKFAEGWWARLALDQTINVVVASPAGFGIDERFVRAVRPGDRVLFIEGQARQNLYDLILSRVHRHPSIELHLALIRRWQADAALAYRRWRLWGIKNHEMLLGLIQAQGSSVTSSLTVAQWLRGTTLCPQDPEDLRRLSEVLDMDFVRTYYRRIYRAASRLRGLHRGLSNRLNRWLEGQVNGVSVHDVDDVIDAELGLTFGDIRDSLLVLRVSALQMVPGPFLPDALGKLERVR